MKHGFSEMRFIRSSKRRRTLQKKGKFVYWNTEHKCYVYVKD